MGLEVGNGSEELVRVTEKTIDIWVTVGQRGTCAYFPRNASLMALQSPSVHLHCTWYHKMLIYDKFISPRHIVANSSISQTT